MVWVVGVILFLIFVTRGAFPGFQTRMKVGEWLELDWRDIIALFTIGLLIYMLVTGQISTREVVTILIFILIGKTIAA